MLMESKLTAYIQAHMKEAKRAVTEALRYRLHTVMNNMPEVF